MKMLSFLSIINIYMNLRARDAMAVKATDQVKEAINA